MRLLLQPGIRMCVCMSQSGTNDLPSVVALSGSPQARNTRKMALASWINAALQSTWWALSHAPAQKVPPTSHTPYLCMGTCCSIPQLIRTYAAAAARAPPHRGHAHEGHREEHQQSTGGPHPFDEPDGQACRLGFHDYRFLPSPSVQHETPRAPASRPPGQQKTWKKSKRRGVRLGQCAHHTHTYLHTPCGRLPLGGRTPRYAHTTLATRARARHEADAPHIQA